MTITDFVANYIMHDSLIDRVEILENGSTIILWIDFAFWMQNWYKETDPETGMLKVTFQGVSNYLIPANADWNDISILEAKIDGDHVIFALINDMTDEDLEIMIHAESVSATVVKDNQQMF